ncbi:hypothetical protein CEQ90_11060 [Lewinellaceae bacterium SD302]|nr:hypothetical protein CEQ90_11060 [Lewinellaceae bacterium SD302]
MNFISDLVYRGLRLMSRGFLRILYPAMMVEGQEYVTRKGPFILAGNHPNTLIDPLIQGIYVSERIHFMANAGMFANPIAHKILMFLGVIPIVRPGKDDDKGGRIDNQSSFEYAYRHFEEGGIMFVAPEGGSELERRLRGPVKMGTAKMALTVESRNDWKLGLDIVPAGGNYEAPTQCFSRAFVRFGPPIHVQDYRESYEKNPRRATVELTREIGNRMVKLVIDTKDKEEEYLLRPLDRTLQNDRPMIVGEHHYRLQKLLVALRAMPENEREELRIKATRYEDLLKEAAITDRVLSDSPQEKQRAGLWLGLPIFLYGALNHLPLLFLTNKAYGVLGVEKNYAATVKGLVGSISLPILYLLQSLIVGLIFGSGWGWIYFFTLPAAGLFALAYHTHYRSFWATKLYGGRVSEEMRQLRGELRTTTDKLLG